MSFQERIKASSWEFRKLCSTPISHRLCDPWKLIKALNFIGHWWTKGWILRFAVRINHKPLEESTPRQALCSSLLPFPGSSCREDQQLQIACWFSFTCIFIEEWKSWGHSGQFQIVLEPLGTSELCVLLCCHMNKSENGTQGGRPKWNSDSRTWSNFCLGRLVEVQKNWVTHVGMEPARPSHVLL